MRNSLLLMLTLSGVSVVSTIFYREYYYVKSQKTWAEAQQYCRDMYADLATVDSKAANTRLLHGIQDPGKHAWIGIYVDPLRWKWSLGNFDFNNEKHFSNWMIGQPDNAGSRSSCVVMQSDGLWSNELCHSKHHAVCFNEQGPAKYILLETLMPWGQALNICRSNYTDLARALNMSEVDEIKSLLSQPAWIGLYTHLRFTWSDRSRITFTSWNVGQPENNSITTTSCAAIDTTTGMWFDDDCEQKREFICQNLFPQKSRIKLMFQSEADLSDPAVQQQILEQLHAKLKTNGSTDFKLRWVDPEGQAFHKEQKKKHYESLHVRMRLKKMGLVICN